MKDKKSSKTKNPEMAESQTCAWQVLNNLGFEDVFDDECVPLAYLVNMKEFSGNGFIVHCIVVSSVLLSL